MSRASANLPPASPSKTTELVPPKSTEALLESLELAPPKPPRPGFLAKAWLQRGWLLAASVVVGVVMMVAGGILDESASFDLADLGIVLGGLGFILGGMGLLFNGAEGHLSKPSLDKRISDWQLKRSGPEQELWQKLNDPERVRQYRVLTQRDLDSLKLKLVEKSYSGERVLEETVLACDEYQDIERGLEIAKEYERQAEKLQQTARCRYLDTHWKRWEKLLEPYDPKIQYLKELETTINQQVSPQFKS